MARPVLQPPPGFLARLGPCLAVFPRRGRPTAAALAVGALLAAGPRAVANRPRALGLARHPGSTRFRRVPNRDTWPGLALARTLSRAAVAAFVPAGPVIVGVDRTPERRRGPRIGPAGRFHDPSRLFVAVMDGGFAALEPPHALRPRMAVTTRMREDAGLFGPPGPFADRLGRPPRTGGRQPSPAARLTDPATRWRRVARPSRSPWRGGGWIEHAHGTALWSCRGKPAVPILRVPVRHPDGRREPEAFLCTDTTATPRGVLDCFDRRWSLETTHEEAGAHLGVETRRQWSDAAVFRTTPLLLGLCSVVALHVHQNAERLALSPRRAAWYPKPAPTFADALARLRRHLRFGRVATSAAPTDTTEPLPPAFQGTVEAACYAP